MHYQWLISVFLKNTSRDQLLQKAYCTLQHQTVFVFLNNEHSEHSQWELTLLATSVLLSLPPSFTAGGFRFNDVLFSLRFLDCKQQQKNSSADIDFHPKMFHATSLAMLFDTNYIKIMQHESW